jgi:predicted enzyme related to lactoylglutathione lyase
MDAVLRFDCIFYYVLDLDRAISFYAGTLGLSLTSRDVVARFNIDGVLMELVPTTDRLQVGGNGNARLTLAVDDIKTVAALLEEEGVWVSQVRQVENGQMGTIADPDGNEIVLWQYANR